MRRVLHLFVLARNNFADRTGEILVVQRFFVFMNRRILPAFALLQNGVIVVFGNCALKIDPRPMQRTGGAAAVLRFAFA